MERQKILIIDDEVDIARLVVEELEAEGFSASFVDNGEEGMELVRKTKPDLVLLDWKLPDMEGVDACRILKSDDETESIPIIMLTAQSSEKNKIKGFEVGAEDYVTKPFSFGELIARIKSILRRVKKREKVVEKEIKKLQKYIPKHMVEKILSAKKMEGERRNVTVLLGDISSFTSMSEKMDPEKLRIILNDFFKLLVGIIYKYEGTVDKFIGDAVMALFGAPIAHEDDPRRAVNVALEMQHKLEEFNEEKKPDIPIKMRIGINSGMVIAGAVGSDMRMDYTVMGDTVNLTSRLQNVAKPGQILITKDTYVRVAENFELNKLNAIQVKGKEDRIQIYEVTGITKERKSKIRPVEGLEISKFVGRNRELELLRKAADKLFLDPPKGQMISIFGDTGIGKSRLIYEFADYIKQKDMIFLKGKGLTYGPSLNYLIFKEMLDSLFQTEIEQRIKEFELENEDILPVIFDFFSVKNKDLSFEKPDADEKKRMIFTSVKKLFLRMAERKPLILRFENLRWVDSASIELLNYLVNEIEKSRILIICAYRTGFEHRWTDKIYYREVELAQLSSEDLKTILSSILTREKLTDKLKEMIVEKSEGNPLFLEEIIKSLIDKKIIVRIEGNWINPQEVVKIEIPESIGALLMPGIDALGENEKKVLQIASCIGKDFKYKTLCSFYENEEELKTSIGNLKKKNIIIEKNSYPEREYSFRQGQGLIRDVIYDSLLHSRRKELKEKIKMM